MADFDDIVKKIKNKIYAPIYFLHGEEAYYIDELANLLEEKVLNETEKAFNQTIVYGKDVDSMAVTDAARRLPMMSEKQVVIVKEAQQMKDLENLEKYANHTVPSTIMVICYKYGKYDARKKLVKTIEAKGGVVFESKKLYDNQVASWIHNYMKQKGFGIDDEASTMLADFLGTELSKVSNELSKLCLNLPAGINVNTKHVEDNIGISKEFNIYELQKALATKDFYKVNLIVNYFASNPKDHPLVVMIGSLYSFYSKVFMAQSARNAPDKDLLAALYPEDVDKPFPKVSWKIREYKQALQHYNRPQAENALLTLHNFDLKAKGLQNTSPEGELMKELVWRLMH